jgi:hypothetical protein
MDTTRRRRFARKRKIDLVAALRHSARAALAIQQAGRIPAPCENEAPHMLDACALGFFMGESPEKSRPGNWKAS